MLENILVAEDNPADLYLIRRALAEHGISRAVQVTCDGDDAMQLISREGPYADRDNLALIILDLNLPRHDGLEILERVRATSELAHVPVVVLTSSDSPQDRLMASQLGATCYLRKPASLEQFLGLGVIFKQLLDQSAAVKTTGC
jgi:CheY-like chemotaxis protein